MISVKICLQTHTLLQIIMIALPLAELFGD
jgi:hypothetical protein